MIAKVRKHPRFECSIEISMVSNGLFFRDRLVNISEGGAMLELTEPRAMANDVMIRASLGTSEVVALGDIKWIKPTNGHRRMGIEFLYLPPEMSTRIRAISED